MSPVALILILFIGDPTSDNAILNASTIVLKGASMFVCPLG